MKTKILLTVFLGLFLFPELVSAQQPATTLLQTSLSQSLDKIFTDLQDMALRWLGIFILAQMIFTQFNNLIAGRDLEAAFAKFTGGLFWAGISLYVFLNGPDFIKSVSSFFLQKATGFAGIGFDPAAPINTGLEIASSLLEQLNSTQGVLQSLSPFPSIMMDVVSVIILAAAAVIAFKVLMIFIETKIVIALSPVAFSMMGLNALRDQGFTPLKYLIAMAYRVLILGAILAAMVSFSDALIAEFKLLPASSDPAFWPPLWASAMGYSLLGALAWKADSIATMLASGSSQMSTGDAAAVGAVAGAAVSAAMSGSSALAGGAAKVAGAAKGPISSLFSKMTAGSEVKNASPGGGVGGQKEPGPAPVRPSSSLSSSSASGENGSAPVRSDYEPPKSGGASGGGGKAPVKEAAGSTGNSSPSSPKTSPSNSAGSGKDAGISGAAPSKTPEQQRGKEPGFTDHLKALGEHAQRESASVQISMNTHSEHS